MSALRRSSSALRAAWGKPGKRARGAVPGPSKTPAQAAADFVHKRLTNPPPQLQHEISRALKAGYSVADINALADRMVAGIIAAPQLAESIILGRVIGLVDGRVRRYEPAEGER